MQGGEAGQPLLQLQLEGLKLRLKGLLFAPSLQSQNHQGRWGGRMTRAPPPTASCDGINIVLAQSVCLGLADSKPFGGRQAVAVAVM